jgi:flagellar M-ring protein FliF
VAPGQVNRQSVAVLVSSAVPASELPAIKAAVNAAAGINAKRGDTVTVQQIPFAKPAATASPTSPTKMLGYAKYGLVGLGALIFLFFVGRQLRKRENESFAGTPTWLRELESPRSLADVEAERAQLDQPTRVMQLRSPVSVAKQQVEDLVERDPDRVASQVRAWMSED